MDSNDFYSLSASPPIYSLFTVYTWTDRNVNNVEQNQNKVPNPGSNFENPQGSSHSEIKGGAGNEKVTPTPYAIGF